MIRTLGGDNRGRRWEYYDLAFGAAPAESLDLYEALFAAEGSRRIRDVLELGCGTGRYLTALAKRGFDMTGVDMDAYALAMAKEKCDWLGLDATLIEAELASWTSQDSYDAVVSPNNSLKWLDSHESLRRCLAEAAKALRPGGVIILDLTFEMANWRDADWGTEEDMAEHVWISRFESSEVSGEYRCFPGVPDLSKGLMPFNERFVCKDCGEDVVIEERTTWLMFSAAELKSWLLETSLLENVRFYERRKSTPTEVEQALLDKWCVQCLVSARKRGRMGWRSSKVKKRDASMMKLSLMIEFFETVSKEWESPLADAIAARWFAEPVIVKCLRASANIVFRVKAPDALYFLRFSHSSERTVPAIEAELDYVNHVSRSGIQVAEPVPSLSGNLVETVSTSLGDFHAVLFKALPGKHWKFEELDSRQFELWGRSLGALHFASKGFETSGRVAWSDHILFAERHIPASEEGALRELRAVSDVLSNLPTDRDSFGLVHYDFELDNISWQDDNAGILDFDDCALHWYAGDIAFALRALFDDRSENVDLEDVRLGAFLRGYRSANGIDDAAIRRIPLFLRMHNLILFARLLYSLGDGPDRDKSAEPEWATALRKKLGDGMDKYRDGFRNHPIGDLPWK